MTVCRNPSCKVGEIIQGQYGAEGDGPFAERLASGYCSKRCRRLYPPSPPSRVSSLEGGWFNHQRPELKAVVKEVPERDAARLAFARSMPCCKCAAIEGIHSHHEAEEGQGTMGGKPSDRRTVPLCGARCHTLRHSQGRSFWGSIDVEKVIAEINEAYDKRRNQGIAASPPLCTVSP